LTLKRAQALGDLRSLRSRGLPLLRVELGRAPSKVWAALAEAAERAAGS